MTWLVVALGGALGAMSRYGLIQLLPQTAPHFPWAIWSANLIGSSLIGLIYVLIMEKGIMPVEWRPFLAVGFLGALTTFSTFALDGILLWQNGQWILALTYVVSTVIGCLVCAVAAMLLAQRFF